MCKLPAPTRQDLLIVPQILRRTAYDDNRFCYSDSTGALQTRPDQRTGSRIDYTQIGVSLIPTHWTLTIPRSCPDAETCEITSARPAYVVVHH